MYSYIKGTLVELGNDRIVVENHGIGYNIRIPQSILSSLPGTGQEVKIYTYTYIREGAMLLYGFLTKDDLQVFRLLIAVSGIGPKGALAVLSVLSPDDLRFAVLAEDDKAIAKAPGIGKKSAQRLIIELKDKLSLEDAFAWKGETASEEIKAPAAVQTVKQEAVEALVALGYSATEAMKAVNGTEPTEESTVEEVLKAALKQMAFI